MKATFKELPAFTRSISQYLSDDDYRELQEYLLENPEAGDVIKETGGLRKLRWQQPARGKGKRGGVRCIYYWYVKKHQFLMFTIYDKDDFDDLSAEQRKALATALKQNQ